MFEIKGKYATAICYAKVVEETAIAQIKTLCDYELSSGCKVRIMPDVHAGRGCTIGTTMTIHDRICPNVVGVDIGCGMYTVQLAEQSIDFEKLDACVHEIPSGMKVWPGRIARFPLENLRCYRALRDTKRIERAIGTLGGGNHFIEIDQSDDGEYYLVIHSGSRNLGKQVAGLYQQLAIDLHQGKGEFFQKKEAVIREYKNNGRRKEIQGILRQMEKEFKAQELDIPESLCWLEGEHMADYLHDVAICQEYAKCNREKMAELIIKGMAFEVKEAFHTVHNYIDIDERILRKGAVSAKQQEKILIPINMRDGSILALGKGNTEWNNSAPHGAGRLMSRGRAKEELSIDAYRESMAGVYTTSVNEYTLDESPMAYKSIDDIMTVVNESVDVIKVIRSVYNFKASDEDAPWHKGKQNKANEEEIEQKEI